MIAVDPAVFGDPLATTTAWTPLAPGGANFATYRLAEAAGNTVVLQRTLAMIGFGAAFLVCGLAVTIALAADREWIAVFGLPFIGVGLWAFRPPPVRIDGAARTFRRREKTVSFSAIHALQILGERVDGSDGDYVSYELNVVLRDGERLNVIDHGNLELLRRDAELLRAMIGCALWDGTAARAPAG